MIRTSMIETRGGIGAAYNGNSQSATSPHNAALQVSDSGTAHNSPISSRLSSFNLSRKRDEFSSSSSIHSSEANYKLEKMFTNRSTDSAYSIEEQYKVSLKLNKNEIELIRYTWNKMLLENLDEGITGFPGAFAGTSGITRGQNSSVVATNQTQAVITGQTGSKSLNYINRTSASTVASSLFCRQFYSNLLSMNSQLEKLFPSIKHQAVSFAGVMSFAISQLENLSTLDDYLINLGKRHLRILGIEPANFELMGEALIQTFHERFGTKFNQELEVLWIKLYLYLANSLLQFGIDPTLKLNDDHTFTLDRKDSYAPSEVSDNSSTMGEKRESISTQATSVGERTYEAIMKKLPVVPEKGVMKKRKRDCVIM